MWKSRSDNGMPSLISPFTSTETRSVPSLPRRSQTTPASTPASVADSSGTVAVPLVKLAVGRSGDKGNNANIGIIARKSDYLPFIKAAVTPDAVQRFFAVTGVTRVDGYELPGISALNFVLHNSLGGGGVVSLRIDPQGKGFAQMMMDFPVPVPAPLAQELMA